jgi:anti-sigma-K factor RskA
MSAEEFELDELLGAYALDAVTDDERRRIEAYLNVNPRARHEVQEHREVAALLAWTGTQAPDGLWDRIAASLDEPAPQPSGELASVLAATPGTPASRSSRRTRWVPKVVPWALASAAAIVAVIAVAALNDESTSPIEAAVDAAREDRDSLVTELVRDDGQVGAEAIIDQDGHGYLLARDLPELAGDQTYQLWGVIDGDAISLGVLGNNPEVELFSAGAPVSALVVTIEQAGGVVSNGNPSGAYAGSLT